MLVVSGWWLVVSGRLGAALVCRRRGLDARGTLTLALSRKGRGDLLASALALSRKGKREPLIGLGA